VKPSSVAQIADRQAVAFTAQDNQRDDQLGCVAKVAMPKKSPVEMNSPGAGVPKSRG